MKPSMGTVAVILGLALAVWMAVYTLTPGAPLTPPETVLVVGVCAAAVLLARWILARVRKSEGSHEQRS